MKEINHILGYLNDCYQADNRGSVLSNIFMSRVENTIFLKKETFINGIDAAFQMDYIEGISLEKLAYTYRKEKDLLYCSTLISGVIENDSGKREVICAPLFMYQASIHSSLLKRTSIVIKELRIITATWLKKK